MAIDNELHARALDEFGYGYMNPTRATDVLSVIFKRIDRAEAESEDLRNQMFDLGHKARRFTTNDQLRAKIAGLEDRAERAEAELKIHLHWHEEAIKLKGPEPGRTPSMVNSWIRNLMNQLEEARVRASRLSSSLAKSEKRIADALARANGRFCEWGGRARMVEDILLGGDGEVDDD